MSTKELVQVIVDADTKRKAIYVLSCKGKDLSTAVREMLEKYADEFGKLN